MIASARSAINAALAARLDDHKKVKVRVVVKAIQLKADRAQADQRQGASALRQRAADRVQARG